jgi:lipopolysaccharide export system protein LptA
MMSRHGISLLPTRCRGAALVIFTGLALAPIGPLLVGPLLAQTTVDTSELAQSARLPGEVNIEADRMEVLDQQKRAIFTGNVDAQRGDILFKTDQLIADYVETARDGGGTGTEVTYLEATGAVVIETAQQRITGGWARMDVKSNKVTVGGNVVVTQGSTVLRGEQLLVDLNANTSEMTGGRVRGRFVPGQ